MRRFKAILFVCGESAVEHTTLKRVAALAEINDATVTVARTVVELPRYSRPFATTVPPREFEEQIMAQHRAELAKLVQPLTEAGVRVKSKVLLGKPFITAIQEIHRGRHDLLAIPVKGNTGFGTRLFGSTALHLIRKCPCPVWAMRAKRRPIRVLAAVDPLGDDVDGSGTAPLSHKILGIASTYAELTGGELHVVNAWTGLREHALRDGARVSGRSLRSWARAARGQHKRHLDELLAHFPAGANERHVHLRKGRPEIVIAKMASKQRVDVIVIGTASRSGVIGLLIGNTAEEVLNRVGCSVLAIKPDGFESPVLPLVKT